MRVVVAAILALACQVARVAPPGLTDDTPPGFDPALTPPGLSPPGITPPATSAAPADTGVPAYRGQVVIADSVAVGLLLVAIDLDDSNRSPAFAKLALGTYLFGAPLVHLAKNRAGRALGSLTLRVALPIVGGFLGDSLTPKPVCYDYCDYNSGPSDTLVLGVLAGFVAASAFDAIYLAKGDAPKQPPRTSWTPTARATHGGFALGVGATF